MKLPPQIAESDVYVIGHEKAFVVARSPYAECPTCHTTHALFIVRDDGYECLSCSGDCP